MVRRGTHRHGSQSLRGVSPCRLIDAPATYPAPRGTIYAATVSNPWVRLGWLLASGTDALDWLPDVLGSDEGALRSWVRNSLVLSYAAGLSVPDAIAAVAVGLTVGEPERVEDIDAFRAAALPRA